MPIKIINKEYTDLTGATRTYYESNAGDKQIVEYLVLEQILVISNAQNYISYNALENTLTWASGNFLIEGFRVGDVVNYRKYDSNGNFIAGTAFSSTIVSITGSNSNILQLVNLDPIAIPDPTNGEYFAIWNALTGARNEELVISVNLVKTGSNGSEFSLIDGEATRVRFDIKNAPNYPFFPSGQIIQGASVGNKSGQYEVTAEIETTALSPLAYGGTVDVGEISKVRFTLINSGILTPTAFSFSYCLKPYVVLEYARLLGEPFYRNQLINTEEANTGYFDEAYNVGIVDATLVSGISELAFDAVTTGQIVIETTSPPTSDIGIGLSYVPNDEAYYKNKLYSQSVAGMTIPTTPAFVFNTPVISPLNPSGASYSFEVTNTTFTGNTVTIDYTFTPLAGFEDFFNSLDEDNRNFLVWVKAKSVNLLAYNSALTSNPPIGGLIFMDSTQVVDHAYNSNDANGNTSGYEANIEDDLAYIGKFRLDRSTPYESLTARLEAFNTVTLEEFSLSSVFFAFNAVPFVVDKYILNFNTPVISILPTTSAKLNAELVLEPSLDTPTQYGVKVYFPFLYRWENWLPQLNANSDFYPNFQTKNYVPYGTFNDWTLRVHIEYVKESLAYVYNDEIVIKDYDSDPNIKQVIEVFRESTGQLVNVIVDGETHIVEATHELTNGETWEIGNTWGQITVEPIESAPRYLISTTVPTDFNPLNPLSPISGSVASLDFITPSLVKITAKFDASKINLEKGVKFTTKIKGCSVKEANKKIKITTDGKIKITTDGKIKILS
jgi:hypothetical protein